MSILSNLHEIALTPLLPVYRWFYVKGSQCNPDIQGLGIFENIENASWGDKRPSSILYLIPYSFSQFQWTWFLAHAQIGRTTGTLSKYLRPSLSFHRFISWRS